MSNSRFILAIICSLFVLVSNSALSQNSSINLLLRGQTLQEDSLGREHSVPEVVITVINLYCDTTLHHSSSDGTYTMRLPSNDLYLLCYQKEGYERKSIMIDTRSISKRLEKNGYQLEIDIVMIPSENPEEQQDCRPVAIADYHFLKNEMVFSKIDDYEKLLTQLEEWQEEAVKEREEY
ncbi:hypothetical protein [Halocola ammonii]